MPPLDQSSGRIVAWRSVGPDYFAAFGIPTLRGRVFQEDDMTSKENIAVLSASLARYPANDLALIGGAAVLLLAVTVAATLPPSLRAARIDPMLALRQE
jgi:hypothetical protein